MIVTLSTIFAAMLITVIAAQTNWFASSDSEVTLAPGTINKL
ncbi:hypothetical protein SZ54_4909 [Rhizobium sp. UR51a]|nr:hypothetical protein SZ54_4909 [Rhizobium sp. UR51a]